MRIEGHSSHRLRNALVDYQLRESGTNYRLGEPVRRVVEIDEQ